MKTFYVTLPITSVITVVVEAEDEKSAETLAFDKANQGKLTVEVPDGDDPIEVGEWMAHKRICQGNVFHGVCNEMEIVEE